MKHTLNKTFFIILPNLTGFLIRILYLYTIFIQSGCLEVLILIHIFINTIIFYINFCNFHLLVRMIDALIRGGIVYEK